MTDSEILHELTTILGPDPVGRAKALLEQIVEGTAQLEMAASDCISLDDSNKALRAALAEKEAARQSLACFALNLAWQNEWTATPEEADPDAALDYVSSKLKEFKDAADLETNELLNELHATNAEQAAKISNLLEENAALADKDAETAEVANETLRECVSKREAETLEARAGLDDANAALAVCHEMIQHLEREREELEAKIRSLSLLLLATT